MPLEFYWSTPFIPCPIKQFVLHRFLYPDAGIHRTANYFGRTFFRRQCIPNVPNYHPQASENGRQDRLKVEILFSYAYPACYPRITKYEFLGTTVYSQLGTVRYYPWPTIMLHL
jgi:hypothetical protein